MEAPTEFVIDLDELELGDVEYLLDKHGDNWMSAVKPGEAGTGEGIKVLIDLVWLTLRHDNPDATIEDARKIKISQVQGTDPDAEEADPNKVSDPSSADA